VEPVEGKIRAALKRELEAVDSHPREWRKKRLA